jgi:NADPH:quinone reductase
VVTAASYAGQVTFIRVFRYVLNLAAETVVAPPPTLYGDSMATDAAKTMHAWGWRTGSRTPQAVEVPLPEVGAGLVRVKVGWSSLNPADIKVSDGDLVGRFLHARVEPLVLGYDFAGPIEAVGSGVSDLKPGDQVFGHLPYAGSTLQGAFAEQLVVPTSSIARVPSGVSLETAASAATGGLTALQSMRDKGHLPSPGKVLIVGAAGGVGSLAVGIAKKMGATVTAVCSTYAVDFVRGLGADEIVDRRKQDPMSAQGPFDVIFDAASAHSFLSARHRLTPKGTYVRTLPDPGIALGKLAGLITGQRCEFITVQSVAADLDQMGVWIAGGMQVPIDSRFPVKDLAKAIARARSGEARGRIAIQVEGGF